MVLWLRLADNPRQSSQYVTLSHLMYLYWPRTLRQISKQICVQNHVEAHLTIGLSHELYVYAGNHFFY